MAIQTLPGTLWSLQYEYIRRARVFLGVAPTSGVSIIMDDGYSRLGVTGATRTVVGANTSATFGTSGAGGTISLQSTVNAAGSYEIAIYSSSVASVPGWARGEATAKHYCAARFKLNDVNNDASMLQAFGWLGWDGAARAVALSMGVNGNATVGNFNFFSAGLGGGTACDIAAGAKNTDWHTFEMYSPGDGRLYGVLDNTAIGNAAAVNNSPLTPWYKISQAATLNAGMTFDWGLWAIPDNERP